MNLSICLYLAWFLNAYYSIITAQDLFPALILICDGEKVDLVDIGSINIDPSFKFAMLACPALDGELNHDLVEQSETSFLIIKQMYQPPFEIENDKICEKQYSPNIIRDNTMDILMFGYKFHFNDDQLKKLSDVIYTSTKDEEWLLDSENEKNMRLLPIQKNVLWFPLMRLNFETNSITSEHLVRAKKYIGDFKNCENFNFGVALMEDAHPHKVYKKEVQIYIMIKFIKPKWNERDINEKYLLVEQQLTPIDDFDSYSKRLATCSYLNVAPMWHTIANGAWKKVEEFMKNLAARVKIKVTTGTSGLLYLPYSFYPHFMGKVKLRNTPVPEGFWKIVEHNKSVEDNLEIRQGIVIFTFNYVSGMVLHEPLCEESVCKKFGWNVENDNYRTGFTYCCRAEEEILSKLGIDIRHEFNDFNLREMDTVDH